MGGSQPASQPSQPASQSESCILSKGRGRAHEAASLERAARCRLARGRRKGSRTGWVGGSQPASQRSQPTKPTRQPVGKQYRSENGRTWLRHSSRRRDVAWHAGGARAVGRGGLGGSQPASQPANQPSQPASQSAQIQKMTRSERGRTRGSRSSWRRKVAWRASDWKDSRSVLRAARLRTRRRLSSRLLGEDGCSAMGRRWQRRWQRVDDDERAAPSTGRRPAQQASRRCQCVRSRPPRSASPSDVCTSERKRTSRGALRASGGWRWLRVGDRERQTARGGRRRAGSRQRRDRGGAGRNGA